MKLFILIFMMSITSISLVKFDYGRNDEIENWKINNDGVMGGLSKGNIDVYENTIKFYGSVSLENNGGFTSYRSPFSKFNLSDVDSVTIRYKSLGRGMGLTLENDRRFYLPYSKLYLASTEGEWTTKTFSIHEFQENRLGEVIRDGVTKDFLSSVIRIGFITADKMAGDFEFEIDYLEFE